MYMCARPHTCICTCVLGHIYVHCTCVLGHTHMDYTCTYICVGTPMPLFKDAYYTALQMHAGISRH